MRSRSQRRGLAIIILLAGFLLPWHSADAAPNRFSSLSLLSVTANLKQDGSVEVDQRLNFVTPTALEWTFFTNVRDLSVLADNQPVGEKSYRLNNTDGATMLTSEVTAENWQLRYQTTTTLIRSNERDQIFLKLLEDSGYFIGEFQAVFRLPSSVSSPGLVGNVYAIGGVGGTETSPTQPNELSYSASQIGPKAVVTINAHWPKSFLRLNAFQEARLSLGNLEILPWLWLGLILPLASLIVLLTLAARQRRQEHGVSTEQAKPPSRLSPLIVGTLVDKKVYPKEIVALLIDLCQRGYVVIVKKNDQYYLTQRRPFDEGLEPWEKNILSTLFPISNLRLTNQEMRQLNRQSLFSPKVRDAFTAIYAVITGKQFFAENPHLTRVRYKLIALGFYFVSVVGAIWIAVSGASPYLLLPLAGTMAICYLIVRLTPGLVHYSAMGKQARHDWLAFGNYLAKPEPLPLEATRNQVFEQNLAYAIALNKTVEWAKRFDQSRTVIVKPDWFISYEETSTAEFVREIEQFSRSISQMLTEMRGPTVN